MKAEKQLVRGTQNCEWLYAGSKITFAIPIRMEGATSGKPDMITDDSTTLTERTFYSEKKYLWD